MITAPFQAEAGRGVLFSGSKSGKKGFQSEQDEEEKRGQGRGEVPAEEQGVGQAEGQEIEPGVEHPGQDAPIRFESLARADDEEQRVKHQPDADQDRYRPIGFHKRGGIMLQQADRESPGCRW